MFDFGWQEAQDAREAAEDGRRRAATLADEVRTLGRRLDEQAAVLQALARLLADRLGLSDAEVMEYVRRAQADRAAAVRTCAACGNRLPPRKSRCIYCGADPPPESVAEAV